MGGLTKEDLKMYTIHETDEATIAAASVAEEKLESGKISGWLSLTLKWLGMVVAAVLLHCSIVLFIMADYPAIKQHPERVWILILLLFITWFVFGLFIFSFAKETYGKTKAYIEAIKLIRKSDGLQGDHYAINKRTRHLDCVLLIID